VQFEPVLTMSCNFRVENAEENRDQLINTTNSPL
jgi:hypothetical protein